MTGARHFRSFVKRATSDASIAIADPAEGSLDAENSDKKRGCTARDAANAVCTSVWFGFDAACNFGSWTQVQH